VTKKCFNEENPPKVAIKGKKRPEKAKNCKKAKGAIEAKKAKETP
jgi:hypothetical protein